MLVCLTSEMHEAQKEKPLLKAGATFVDYE
jgi:hypothetical protein